MAADSAQLATLAAGSLYVLLSLAVWSLLRVPQHAVSVRLWTAAALLVGAGFVLSAYRPMLPDWVSGLVLNGMALGSQYLRILALRRHMDMPLQLGRGGLLLLGALAALALGTLVPDQRPRTSFACVAIALLSLVLAWHAQQAAGRSGSRSARLLAWCEYPLALMLLVRGAMVWLPAAPLLVHPVQVGADWLPLLVTVAVVAIYSNLAYLGLVLDDTRHDERLARQEQAAEVRARHEAVAHAEQLGVLLQQRDLLARERQRTLDLLAHEIRQPLHDAGGALQATHAALHDLPQDMSARAQQRLQRAQAVLGNVQSVLDNTLTAAALLTRQTPLSLHETELQFLIDLVLGDLQPDERNRLQVDWQSDLRVADIEPGLMRLALRNLLTNALRHGGSQTQVLLRIAEQDAPPALLLEVQDDGPGMPVAQMQDASGVLPAADGTLPAGGLGLTIVREVVRRHGGHLRLAGASPSGLRATLVLPLPG